MNVGRRVRHGMEVTFYGDFKRLDSVCLVVVSLDDVAGEIVCPDCDGSGDASRYMPEPERGPVDCVTCKGTGRMLVSV